MDWERDYQSGTRFVREGWKLAETDGRRQRGDGVNRELAEGA
jgi:hypothetical protein